MIRDGTRAVLYGEMPDNVWSCRRDSPCAGACVVAPNLLRRQLVEFVALFAQDGKDREDRRAVRNKARIRSRAQGQMEIHEIKTQSFLPGLGLVRLISFLLLR